MKIQILSCPFCEGKEIIIKETGSGACIICRACGVRTGVMDKKSAVNLWNTSSEKRVKCLGVRF